MSHLLSSANVKLRHCSILRLWEFDLQHASATKVLRYDPPMALTGASGARFLSQCQSCGCFSRKVCAHSDYMMYTMCMCINLSSCKPVGATQPHAPLSQKIRGKKVHGNPTFDWHRCLDSNRCPSGQQCCESSVLAQQAASSHPVCSQMLLLRCRPFTQTVEVHCPRSGVLRRLKRVYFHLVWA